MAFIFLSQFQNKPLRYTVFLKLIFYLLLATITAIFISYFTGRFGGREYWEFPPALGLPLMIAWISFLALFFANLNSLRNRPVYVWMWTTGFVFLTFTFIESYLWTMPWFRNHIVNDMTIQWNPTVRWWVRGTCSSMVRVFFSSTKLPAKKNIVIPKWPLDSTSSDSST